MTDIFAFILIMECKTVDNGKASNPKSTTIPIQEWKYIMNLNSTVSMTHVPSNALVANCIGSPHEKRRKKASAMLTIVETMIRHHAAFF
jgi:hypothetical protein